MPTDSNYDASVLLSMMSTGLSESLDSFNGPFDHGNSKNYRWSVQKGIDAAFAEIKDKKGYALSAPKAEKRRKAAVLTFIDYITDENKYQDINYEKALADLGAICKEIPIQVAPEIMSTAVALNMLDNLMEQNRLNIACKYLRFDRSILSRTDLLPKGFDDSTHDVYLIKAMSYLILFRDEIFVDGSEPIPETAFVSSRYHFNDKYYGLEPSDGLTNRQRLDSIISLIPVEEYNKAITIVSEYVPTLIDKYLDTFKYYFDRTKETMSEIVSKIKRTQPVVSLMPYAGQNTLPGEVAPLQQRMVAYTTINENLPHLFVYRGELETRVTYQLLEIAASLGIKRDLDVLQKFCDPLLDIMNPYQICYAAFMMMDMGQDAYWFLPVFSALVCEAESNLPWASYCLDIKEADDWIDYLNDKQDSEMPQRLIYHRDIENFFPKSDYHPNIDPKKLNLAQIIYSTTGYVLPRSFWAVTQDLIDWMKDKEFSDNERTYLSLLIQIATSDFYRKNFGLQMPVYNQIDLDEPHLQTEEIPSDVVIEPEDTPSDTEEDTRDQMITKLKSELKQAKSLWADSDHTYTELLGKYNELNKEYSVLNQEAASLRDVVYMITNEDVAAETAQEEPMVLFPYRPSLRMVIIGGHESWVKQMKSYLDDVTYIDKGISRIDDNIIRNADMILVA